MAKRTSTGELVYETPVQDMLRRLYGHRAGGDYIGLPWNEWKSLKLEIEATEQSQWVLRSAPNGKYPDAMFVAFQDVQQARSATQVACLTGWYFYPVVR